MSGVRRITTANVAVTARSRLELLRQPYALKITRGCSVRKRAAKAYRFRLHGYAAWLVYVGPERNKVDTGRALAAMFGETLRDVRVHPLCDPFPTPENLCHRRKS